jgi:hypothetical protein
MLGRRKHEDMVREREQQYSGGLKLMSIVGRARGDIDARLMAA